MRLKKKKKASKPSRVPTVDNFGTCDFCGRRFNWRYEPAMVNAAGKEFCRDQCFRGNMEKIARLSGSIEFDDL